MAQYGQRQCRPELVGSTVRFREETIPKMFPPELYSVLFAIKSV